jgi:hypothetical protein
MRETNCGRIEGFLLGGFSNAGARHLLSDASQHCFRGFFPGFLLRHNPYDGIWLGQLLFNPIHKG